VKLVEHQEAQPGGLLEQRRVVRPRQDQLQHHVVGEQDVWRARDDLGALGLVLLAGVAAERHRRTGEVLLQLTELAVGQRVHRVDDDRLDAGRPRRAQHVVDDRHDVREALARAGAGGQHVAGAAAGRAEALDLVAVEAHGTGRDTIGPAVRKDVAAGGVQLTGGDQLVERVARLEGRADLQQRLRPQPPAFELSVDVRADPHVADREEAPHVAGVVVDDSTAKIEDVHGCP
jgi:hypothetical protein